jgi:hypothetical protein
MKTAKLAIQARTLLSSSQNSHSETEVLREEVSHSESLFIVWIPSATALFQLHLEFTLSLCPTLSACLGYSPHTEPSSTPANIFSCL